ncbi:polysaccharide biosynthesis tyrosine autokinase [Mycolicibacterium aichiense]|uniref:polysaccharide biosynthesis tyrosine autokinase n=1 Tax=Mycolicibacterium aichiense TaxID=1799 RepID=UPI003D67A2A4
MNLRDIAKLLRERWITICAGALVGLLCAIAVTLLTTPLYQATTRLFVSTSSGASVSDLYQGNLFSQERVLSYAELLTGETVAQRTVDKLGLNMSASALRAKVKATAKPDTVLIDVAVRDPSPVRARDIANALSDEFVVLVSELETPRVGGTPDARVVVEQRASIPSNPVLPNKLRNLGIGIALGVLAGVGLAVVRDLMDNTVKDKEILEEVTSASVVGYIPLDRDLRVSPALSFDSDNSPSTESFRKLRTNLQFLAVDDPPRLIVVTSSLPNEGKTTTSVNIALALAEAEHNVVLVDGDLRRPTLAKHLDVVGTAGLSTVLSGAASLDDVLQKTKFPHLTVLTAGPNPPNPSELLGSQAAKKVLGELRSQFDYVIVDSSPLLAVTDGAILAANADGTLVVARCADTKREQLGHAIEVLNDVGAKLLGAVLTMIPTRGPRSYTYDHYYHYGDTPRQPERITTKSTEEAVTAGDGSEIVRAANKSDTAND